uniref:Protocadherin alpha subfamily C, 2 n=1 Tax=Junco hyemalis TaxID=40217 RepID=A0A8C5IJ15_JUNHY
MRGYLMVFCLICCTADGQIVYSIAEETERGASVGNIAKDLGIDAATLSARKFRMITGSSKQYFNINASTGALSVNEPIDREQLCELKSVCLLNYELVLENPLELYRMEFKVLDINDNSPSFPLSEYHINMPEFLSPGARFTLPTAQDLDEGANSVQNYTLSPDEHFYLEMQIRGDGSKYPELVLKKALDREQQATHRLVLTAKDGGNPPKSGDVPVIVTVLDSNDNAPEFEHSVYRASILENSPSGTLVVQVHATDLDEGPNGEVRYSFSNTTSADLQRMFSVHPHTGEVTVNGVLAVQRPLLEMLIEARDNGAFGMSSTAKLLVEITDVNNHGPEITITSLSSPIPEDAVPGTVIALLSILDKDPGENGKVTCQISENLPFQLKPSLQNYYSLVTSELLDRELISEYNITITATDLGSPPLTTQKTVWVQISDVNDNPPVFGADAFDVFVEENNPLGAFLYQVSASDPDIGENGRVSYTLRNSTVAGSALTSFLSMNLANGSIYAKRAFDFEQLRSFHFQVEAKDNGSPALSAATTVNVYISDQNDNAPAILYPTSQNGSVAVEVVPRLADEDYLVTKVVADDEDNAENAWLSYHLAHSSDSTLFQLSPHTGELRTTRSMRSTDFLKHKVVVVVRDHGDPPLSSTVTVGILLADTLPQALPDFDDSGEPPPLLNATNIYLIISLACVSSTVTVYIYVVDENDHAPQILYPTSTNTSAALEMIPRSAYAGYLVTKIIAIDGDSGQNAWLFFSLVQTSDPGLFRIELHTGEIRTTRKLGEDSTPTFNLTVEVRDNGEPSMSSSVAITIAVVDRVSKIIPDRRRHFKSPSNYSEVTLYLIIALSAISFVFLFTLIGLSIIKCYRYSTYGSSCCAGCCTVRERSPPHFIEVRGNGSLTKTYCYKACLTAGSGSDTFMFYNTCGPTGTTGPSAVMCNENPFSRHLGRFCLLPHYDDDVL